MKIIVLAAALILLFSLFSAAQPARCDYGVEIQLNGTQFEKSGFKFRIKATKIDGIPTNITGTAEISDIKGNTIRKYILWNNESISRQKTSGYYSPNLKEGRYILSSRIDVLCDDYNSGNNIDSKPAEITIILPKYLPSLTENASVPQETLIPAQNNFQLPEKYNESARENISASKVAESIVQANATTPTAAEYDNTIYTMGDQKNIAAKDSAEENIVYKSSSQKSEELVVYFLLGLSLILNVVLIWKR